MSGDPCSVGFFCEGGVQDKKPCEAEAGEFCAAGGGTPEGSFATSASSAWAEQLRRRSAQILRPDITVDR